MELNINYYNFVKKAVKEVGVKKLLKKFVHYFTQNAITFT